MGAILLSAIGLDWAFSNATVSAIIFQEAERQVDKVREGRQDSEIMTSEHCLQRVKHFGKTGLLPQIA